MCGYCIKLTDLTNFNSTIQIKTSHFVQRTTKCGSLSIYLGKNKLFE